MLLSELQLAGFGPIRNSLKLSFEDGYNAVWAGTGAGKTSVARAILAVIQEEYASSARDTLRNRRPVTDQFKVVADFSQEKRLMRCVRDFSTETAKVMVQDALGSKVRDEGPSSPIGNLIDHFDFCMADDWRTVFFCSSATGRGGGAGAAVDLDADLTGRDATSLQKELQHLQEEKMLMGSTSGVQGKADDLQHQIIDAEKRLEDIESILAVAQTHQSYLDAKASLEDAGPPLMERARNYSALDKKFENKTYAYHIKKDELNELLKKPQSKKRWFADPKYGASLLLFLASLIAAGITSKQVIAIPGLLALGYAGYLSWRYFAIGTVVHELEQKLEDEGRSFAKEEKKHKEAVGLLFELQKTYKLVSPEDLVALWDEYLVHKKKLAQWEENNNRSQLETEKAILLEELEGKRGKHDEILGILSDASGGGQDDRELERRIEALSKALQKVQEQGGVVVGGASAAFVGGEAEEPSLVDGEILLAAAARVARMDQTVFTEYVIARVDRLIRHFLGGRWGHLLWEVDTWVLRSADGERDVPASELSAGEQEVLTALIRFGVWQSLPSDRQLPIVLDDPFARFDDNSARRMAKLLQKVAERGQVIHLTGRKLFAQSESSQILSTG